jgi:hypothetical protein
MYVQILERNCPILEIKSSCFATSNCLELDFEIYSYTQRQRCNRFERFFKKEENIFVFKTNWATRGFVNFYRAGVVNFYRAGVVNIYRAAVVNFTALAL